MSAYSDADLLAHVSKGGTPSRRDEHRLCAVTVAEHAGHSLDLTVAAFSKREARVVAVEYATRFEGLLPAFTTRAISCEPLGG